MNWYEIAGDKMTSYAEKYAVEKWRVCLLVAQLSINKSWRDNLTCFESFMTAGNAKHLGYVSERCKQLLTVANFEDGLIIIKGNNGNKIMNFARNLNGDMEAVTIDRHAYRTASHFVKLPN